MLLLYLIYLQNQLKKVDIPYQYYIDIMNFLKIEQKYHQLLLYHTLIVFKMAIKQQPHHENLFQVILRFQAILCDIFSLKHNLILKNILISILEFCNIILDSNTEPKNI